MQIQEILNNPWVAVFGGILLILLLLWPVYGILKGTKNKKIWLSLYVFGLVFGARIWVVMTGIIQTSEGLQTTELLGHEKILDSLLHTLQTFSMDEDYTQYTLEGKRILVSCGLGNWSVVYGLIISVLNVAAPLQRKYLKRSIGAARYRM